MKKTQNQRRWLYAVAMAVVSLLAAACSTTDDDFDAPVMNSSDTEFPAVYDGEWTVNRQVVDTARLVVQSTMRVRLPETYLLDLLLSVGGSMAASTPVADALGHTTEIAFAAQGYSEHSEYMYFASPAVFGSDADGIGSEVRFIACSFDAIIDDMPCRVSLLSRENASAVLQKDTGQWTLAIPLCAFLVTSSSTGQSAVLTLPATVSLYYNTKRRTA